MQSTESLQMTSTLIQVAWICLYLAVIVLVTEGVQYAITKYTTPKDDDDKRIP